MYVRELNLTNVRQFESRSFYFQPGFNLLVGENGAGKTTALRSLLTVLTIPRRQGRLHALTLNDDYIRLNSPELQITAVVAAQNGRIVGSPKYWRKLGRRASRMSSAMADGPLVMWYGSNEATCSSFVGRRVKAYFPSAKPGIAREEEWLYEQGGRPQSDSGPGQKFGRSEDVARFVRRILSKFSPQFTEFRWSFEPYDCAIYAGERAVERQGPSESERRSLARLVMRHLQEGKNPLRGFDHASVTIDSSGYVVGARDAGQVLPMFRDLIRTIKDIEPTSRLESWEAEVRLTPRILIRGTAGDFLLHQLSDGEQRLFSLFVDIARQLSVRASTTLEFQQVPAVILIDEIDVHLHPRWQVMIVEALQELFPACQFIATTHSPFVVQAVQENRVQHINRELVGGFTDRGIEEIAVKVMDIKVPSVSRRYLQMLDSAKDYFRALEQADRENPNTIAVLKIRFDELSQNFADNPAYQAYIELRRDARLGPDPS